MGNLNFLFQNNITEICIRCIKTIMISICIYCTNFRIVNRKVEFSIINFIEIICISVISIFFRFNVNLATEKICLLFMMCMLFSHYKINNAITVTIMSFVINYSISIVSFILNYILNKVVLISND